MKLFIGIAFIFVAHFASAQTDPCSFSCDQNCANYAGQLSFRLNQINQTCGWTNPGPVPFGKVEFYHSDNCTSDLIGSAAPTTNCDKFATAARTWGIKYNGKCVDVSDMDTINACYVFRSINDPNAVIFYHSDNCSSDMLAAVSPGQDCKAIGKYVSNRVWGMKSNGTCQDITDDDFVPACERFSLLKKLVSQ